MPLENINQEDFTSLREARAVQIDKEFDKMSSDQKITSNKELTELDEAQKKERKSLKGQMQGEEAAEVADTFLQMNDTGLKTFLETFRGQERSETAGKYAMYHIAVQVLCERLGFYPGDIDGIYGIDKTTGTRHAVIQLQKKINGWSGKKEETLAEDGLLGKETLGKVLDKWDELINSTVEEAEKITFNEAQKKLQETFLDLDLNTAGEWTAGCSDNSIIRMIGGTIYYGSYRDGMIEGKGYMIGEKGSIYEGGWKNGERDGQGRYVTCDKKEYRGKWISGKLMVEEKGYTIHDLDNDKNDIILEALYNQPGSVSYKKVDNGYKFIFHGNDKRLFTHTIIGRGLDVETMHKQMQDMVDSALKKVERILDISDTYGVDYFEKDGNDVELNIKGALLDSVIIDNIKEKYNIPPITMVNFLNNMYDIKK